MKQIALQLANYNAIAMWKPQVGDVVIHHGFLQHWFGIVNSINQGSVTVVRAGLPVLMLTMDEHDMAKNKQELSIQIVRNSRGGKYAAIQNMQGTQTWYV